MDDQDGKEKPDYSIKPVSEGAKDEDPLVIKIKRLATERPETRREFLKSLAGIAGIAALSGMVAGCDPSAVSISTDANGNCTCHVVCACDTENDGQTSTYGSVYDGVVCTCDTVCTCNTVSSCSCDSNSGGSCGYWYPN